MRLEVVCRDRIGIAKEILAILVEHEIMLTAIETDPRRNVFLSFGELDFSELQVLLPELRRIEGVEDVRTIPFTPMERSYFELETMFHSTPEPVFSIDEKGRVVKANAAALLALRLEEGAVLKQGLNHFIHGFSFLRWLERPEIKQDSVDVTLANKRYIAMVSPIQISSTNSEHLNLGTLAGALVVLKSPQRMHQRHGQLCANSDDHFEHIQFKSPQMAHVVEQAKKMADLKAPLLIQGETGTGKEILARACHESSHRCDKPFIALNCASLPDNVAESELFGYVENDGSGETSRGVLETANGGTVFLDDICEMSPALQVKFLRFLNDGTFRRIGEEQEMQVDVRVICSTQKELADLVQEGLFREDLFYRLNVLSLVVPPLRERKSDILPLAEYFVEMFCADNMRSTVLLNKSCRDYIVQYPWPGNVRQLENALYRAINLSDSDELTAEDLQLPAYAASFGYFDDAFDGSLDEAIKRFESSLLRRLYPAYPSTRQLAKKLGVSHTAIANKLREYGINKNTVS